MSALIPSGNATGTGTMTLLAPPTNGTQTVTIPDATGTMMVSGNMPAFQAYQSSSLTVTSASTTSFNCNTKEFDTATAYNNTGSTATLNGLSVPAYSFMPPIAGYYLANVGLQMNTGTGFARGFIQLYKTGSLYKRLQDTSASAPVSMGGSALVYLNGTTDYITAYGYIQATAGTLTFNAGTDATYFAAFLVRAA